MEEQRARERDRGEAGQREELGGASLSTQGSRSVEGGAEGRAATPGFSLGRYRREVEDDRDDFARNPLDLPLTNATRSFSLLFFCFIFKPAVKQLIEVSNEFQIL